jgi:hypothetical protein
VDIFTYYFLAILPMLRRAQEKAEKGGEVGVETGAVVKPMRGGNPYTAKNNT